MPAPSGETTVTGIPTRTRERRRQLPAEEDAGQRRTGGRLLRHLDDVVVRSVDPPGERVRTGMSSGWASQRMSPPGRMFLGRSVTWPVVSGSTPLMIAPSTWASLATITWPRRNGVWPTTPGTPAIFFITSGYSASLPGVPVLQHHHVGVGAEDLLLEIHLEAAHHAEHDDQRHHPHADAAHAERGHHLGGGLALLLSLVQRLGGGQRVATAELADPRPLHHRVGGAEDAEDDQRRNDAQQEHHQPAEQEPRPEHVHVPPGHEQLEPGAHVEPARGVGHEAGEDAQGEPEDEEAEREPVPSSGRPRRFAR